MTVGPLPTAAAAGRAAGRPDGRRRRGCCWRCPVLAGMAAGWLLTRRLAERRQWPRSPERRPRTGRPGAGRAGWSWCSARPRSPARSPAWCSALLAWLSGGSLGDGRLADDRPGPVAGRAGRRPPWSRCRRHRRGGGRALPPARSAADQPALTAAVPARTASAVSTRASGCHGARRSSTTRSSGRATARCATPAAAGCRSRQGRDARPGRECPVARSRVGPAIGCSGDRPRARPPGRPRLRLRQQPPGPARRRRRSRVRRAGGRRRRRPGRHRRPRPGRRRRRADLRRTR